MPVEAARTRLGRRRLVRTLALALGGVCVFAGLLLLALHSRPARKFALDRAVAFLASQRIDFQANDLQYNLLSLSIDLKNVQLRAAGSADVPVFARIGHARVDLSLPQLLRGRVVVAT